jgi:putative membrane protein
MNRTIKDYGLILLKGVGMGAADVVPGVSGGTIAFIVGIYQELLDSIKSINFASLKLFFTFKWKEFWKAIHGNFLLSLILGIGISIFSLAKMITYLLTEHPVLVWAFFFGLVLASTWIVVQDVKQWNWKTVISFTAGAIIAFFITLATPAKTPDEYWFIFICGAIAICAMILPGISGSFILVLLGKYFFIMEALKSLNISVLLVFSGGIIVGITSFSRILSFALRRFHDITIAALSGFMLGSLNKVWPWKSVVETYIDSHGIEKPLVEANKLPDQYIWQAIVLAILGFAIVYFLEKLSGKNKKR